MKLPLLASLLPFVLLAACQDDAAPAEGEGDVSGEVLEGTISDAMLPLDTVQSQPPLLNPEGETGEGGESAPATGPSPDATATSQAESEPEPAPAETPEE